VVVNKDMKKEILNELHERQNLLNLVINSARDPSYFIEHYAKIQHPTKGAVPFKPYKKQEQLLYSYQENRWNITLGSRQTGITITNALYAFWFAMFKSDKTIMIAGEKLRHSKDILHSIRFAYENLPKWLQARNKLVINNKCMMQFENGTRILAIAPTIYAVRGFSVDLMILDCFAYMSPNKQEEFYTSLYPATMGSKNSVMIMSSTGGGYDGVFTSIWDDALAKKNKFVANFIKWNDVPERDDGFKDSMVSMLGETRWKVEYECSFDN